MINEANIPCSQDKWNNPGVNVLLAGLEHISSEGSALTDKSLAYLPLTHLLGKFGKYAPNTCWVEGNKVLLLNVKGANDNSRSFSIKGETDGGSEPSDFFRSLRIKGASLVISLSSSSLIISSFIIFFSMLCMDSMGGIKLHTGEGFAASATMSFTVLLF